jgi:hypothetical protein
MPYLFLALSAALVLYEIAARIAERNRRHTDLHEDARLNRARILNQQGDLE